MRCVCRGRGWEVAVGFFPRQRLDIRHCWRGVYRRSVPAHAVFHIELNDAKAPL